MKLCSLCTYIFVQESVVTTLWKGSSVGLAPAAWSVMDRSASRGEVAIFAPAQKVTLLP